MVRRLESADAAVNNVGTSPTTLMLETGQPLHAFDLDRGRGAGRGAPPQPGERLTTLDGDEHELPAGTLVIADAEKPVAIAGVMGGLDSEIGPETRRILLESACFHSGTVRRASLHLGLRTESSRRFEKGMDPQRVVLGSARAAHLLGSLAGRVVPGLVDRGAQPQPPTEIMLRPARVRQVLGIEIPVDRIRVLLEALEFSCTPEEPGLKVRVPSHRQDVLEADLIEEVARHYGYDNLPVTVPHGEPQGAMPAEDELEEWVRDSLARLGWSELLTPSLHHPELLERYRLEAQPATVMNPLSEDQRVLRPALFPSLVEVVRRNLRVRNRDLCFFEISRVFHPQGQEVLEPLRLGLALCRPGMGFLDLKGALEQLALMAGLDFVFESSPQAWLHPGRAARIRVGEQILGWAGEIHPHLAGELDLRRRWPWPVGPGPPFRPALARAVSADPAVPEVERTWPCWSPKRSLRGPWPGGWPRPGGPGSGAGLFSTSTTEPRFPRAQEWAFRVLLQAPTARLPRMRSARLAKNTENDRAGILGSPAGLTLS